VDQTTSGKNSDGNKQSDQYYKMNTLDQAIMQMTGKQSLDRNTMPRFDSMGDIN